MPIGSGIVYNTGDLILSQVSSSGTAFLETKIAAATSSLIYFDSTARINSASLNSITVGTSSYVSGSTSIITNLTASNISASGTGSFGYIGIGTTIPNSKLEVAGTAGTGVVSVTNTGNGRSGSFGIDGNGVFIRNSNDGDYFDLKNATGTSRFRVLYDNNTFLNTTYTSVGSLTQSGSKLSVFGNLSVGSTYGPITASSNGAIIEGDVGIGTTTPTAQSNYRFLQVNGTNSAVIETMVGGTRIGGFDSTSNTLYVGSIGSFPVVFRTAVDEKMRITAAGLVGIGTSSPAQKLEVQSGSVLIRGDGNALFGTYYASAGENTFFTLHSGSGNTFHIGNDVSGTNYNTMVFTAATDSTGGKVGIGTSSPGSKLQINDNTPVLTIRANDGGTSRKAYIDFYTTFFNYPSDVGARRTSTIVTGFDSGVWGTEFLAFNVGSGSANDSALLPIERVRIDGSGNLGVGTSTIIGKLQVNSTSAPYYGPATSSATANGIFILGNTTADVVNTFGVDASATAYAWIQPRKTGTATYYSLALNPNGGNVGIGTTAPAYLLDVSGSSRHGYRTADNHYFTGSVNISGSLNATASWANNVVSASFATTAQTANALNTANSYTVTNLTASNVLRAAKIAEKVVTFTPLTGSLTGAPAWYRIISGSGILDSGRVRMSANYDNSRSDIEFTYAVRNYDTDGAGAFINITRASTYNSLFNAVRVIETGNLAEPYAIDVLIGNYLNNTTPDTVTCLYESQFIGAVLDTPTFVSASATGSNIVKTVYTTYTSGYPRIGPTYSDGLAVANYQGQLTVGYRGNYAYNTPSTLNYALLVSGSVGIGTTAPADKLSVISGSTRIASTTLAGALYLGNDGSNIYLQRDNSYDLSLVQNGDSNSALYLASAGNVYVNIDSNNNDTDKAFIVQNNALKAGTELFRIQENGNVGVGTSSPAAKLHIYNGSSHFESTSNGNATIVAGLYALQIGPLHDRDSTAGRYYGGIAFNHLLNFGGATTYNGAPQAWIGTRLQDTTGSERDYLVFATKPGTGVSGTGNDIPIERMCIDRDGLVGIGTTSPGYLLDVSGSSRFGYRTADTHQFTGSVSVSGSLNATASWASNALTASYLTPTNSYTITNLTASNISASATGSFGRVGVGTNDTANGLLSLHGTYPQLNINNPSTGSGVVIQLRDNGRAAGAIGHFTSTNYLQFSTAGQTAQITLTDTGNLGIGTTSPTTKLYVSGSVTALDGRFVSNVTSGTDKYFLDCYGTSTNQIFALYENSNTAYLNSYSSMAFRANQNGGSGGYFVFSGANVGIGTTSPTNGTLQVYNASGNTLSLQKAAGGAALAMGSDTTNYALIESINAGGIRFYTGNGTQTEQLRIDINGNVGIGTTNPVAKLQVAGNVSGSSFTSSISNAVGFLGTSSWANNVVSASYATTAQTANALNTGNSYTIAGLTNNGTLSQQGTLSMGSGYQILATTGTVTNPGISFVADTNTGFYTPSADNIGIVTNGSEKVRIDSSGNVGVGSSSPSSKFEVLTSAVGLANQPNIIGNFRGDTDGRSLIRVDNTSTSAGAAALQAGISFVVYSNVSSQPSANKHEAQIILGSTGATSVTGGQTGTLQIVAPQDIAFNVSASNTIMTGSNYTTFGYNAMYIARSGNVGIGTVTPAAKLEITGSSNSALLNIKSPISGAILYVSGSGAVGIGTSNVGAFTLQVSGSFGATTKSFIIDHPTKAGKKLMYGSLESPYHGIRLTGRDTLKEGKCKVELPDYIYKLILHDSVNIQLTGIKCNKTLYVDEINIPENYFTIAYDKAIFESYKDYDFFWDFTAIRADVPELQTEM